VHRSFWLPAAVTAILAIAPRPAVAQDEAALRAFFEGRPVVVRIDMPGDADGVNVPVERPFNQREYRDRLVRYGVALRAGERVTVTLVKVKDELVEFQLNGGGFGTFGDDTSTSANIPSVEKSNRERDLEKLVRDEKDPVRKRALQRELQDLQNARDRENRRIAAERLLVEEQKRRLVAERRRQGGSRFNLRYPSKVPVGLRPEDLMALLAEYVDFSAMDGPPAASSESVSGQPRRGMLRHEAERLFGPPVRASDRREGALVVTTLTFERGDERITAEFVEDVLIRFVIGRREFRNAARD
jgi:hypothetical protein